MTVDQLISQAEQQLANAVCALALMPGRPEGQSRLSRVALEYARQGTAAVQELENRLNSIQPPNPDSLIPPDHI
jgi:hypothetical protein